MKNIVFDWLFVIFFLVRESFRRANYRLRLMAKFTRLYRIACAGLQTILHRASVHAGDFRAISVTKLKCASPISYCKCRVTLSDSCSHYTGQLFVG